MFLIILLVPRLHILFDRLTILIGVTALSRFLILNHVPHYLLPSFIVYLTIIGHYLLIMRSVLVFILPIIFSL